MLLKLAIGVGLGSGVAAITWATNAFGFLCSCQ